MGQFNSVATAGYARWLRSADGAAGVERRPVLTTFALPVWRGARLASAKRPLQGLGAGEAFGLRPLAQKAVRLHEGQTSDWTDYIILKPRTLPLYEDVAKKIPGTQAGVMDGRKVGSLGETLRGVGAVTMRAHPVELIGKAQSQAPLFTTMPWAGLQKHQGVERGARLNGGAEFDAGLTRKPLRAEGTASSRRVNRERGAALASFGGQAAALASFGGQAAQVLWSGVSAKVRNAGLDLSRLHEMGTTKAVTASTKRAQANVAGSLKDVRAWGMTARLNMQLDNSNYIYDNSPDKRLAKIVVKKNESTALDSNVRERQGWYLLRRTFRAGRAAAIPRAQALVGSLTGQTFEKVTVSAGKMREAVAKERTAMRQGSPADLTVAQPTWNPFDVREEAKVQTDSERLVDSLVRQLRIGLDMTSEGVY